LHAKKYKLRTLIVVFTCFFMSCVGYAKSFEQGAYSAKPAKKWQEALVTGNGQTGVMVFGDPLNEQIVFNHEKLFEPLRDNVIKAPDVAEFLPQFRKMFLAGKYVQAANWFYDRCLEKGYPGLLWTDPYHPAFEMKIQSDVAQPISDYSRFTDFTSGQITVKWSKGQRRTFVSRPDGIVVQDIRSPNGQKLSCRITLSTDWLDRYRKKTYKDGGFKTPNIEIGSQWFRFRLAYAKTIRGYESLTRVIVNGGSSAVSNGWLEIKNADSVLLLTKIIPLEDFSDSKLAQAKADLSKLPNDYDLLLDRHAKVHGEMFNRVSLDLGGDTSQANCSNESLIKAQKEMPADQLHPVLLKKMFDMGRFSLICSSGDWPPNLMGLWTADARPKWSGDYTLDANINLQVSAVNLANLPECLKSYSNLIQGLIPSWQQNAKRLYGCRGVLSGIRTSGRENNSTHHSRGFQGFFWTAGAAWLTLPLTEYYETSGDRDYLKNT